MICSLLWIGNKRWVLLLAEKALAVFGAGGRRTEELQQ